jgi:hypothetical protein
MKQLNRAYHKVEYIQIAALPQTKLSLGLPPKEDIGGRERPGIAREHYGRQSYDRHATGYSNTKHILFFQRHHMSIWTSWSPLRVVAEV